MPAPSTTDEYLALVAKSELLPAARLEEFIARRRADNTLPVDNVIKTAQLLIFDGLITKYQAEQLLGGRWRNFIIGGKYKLLERLGKGGMALVFLCEHQVMKRLVALKILPTAHAGDKELLGRFHREARALSQLRHPNIVGAYDADRADKVHFLVMEYVDGGDLDRLVQKAGPLSWERASNYIRQAANGLQHAHECGLVHRDIKPGNVLVDRSGTVKLLDLGLARIFHESTDDLTTGRDAKTLLGTVDYLAPEQALNSHDVDIRADIYSLGATFYYLLTGKGLFEDGTIAQKLSWHLHRPPVPLHDVRPDVPEGLGEVIKTMLAKKPEDRYQTPEEVCEALEPWTRTPIEPPSPEELPQLSLAARASGQPSSVRMTAPSAKTPLPDSTKRPERLSRTTMIIPGGAPSGTTRVPSGTKHEGSTVEPKALPPRGRAATPSWRRKAKSVAAVAAALLGIAAGGWYAFFWPSGNDLVGSEPKKPTGSVMKSTTAPPASDATSPGRPQSVEEADASISVASGSANPRTYATLREAIRSAKGGDRVVVRGSLLVDAVDLSDVEGAPKGLSIEGINVRSKGQPVLWRAPRDLSAGRALLDVSGLDGFRLRGFRFDGQGRVADLVRMSGRGAGSTLEDLQFEGATRAAITLRAWAGESGRPSTIERVQFSTSAESEAAILFESVSERPTASSESIRVLSCRFVGPFQAALMVAGPVNGLEVEQCRFYLATDGLRYRRTETRDPLRVRLVNNTFSDLQRGIHFETTPPSATSELVATNNLFLSTTRMATLDRISVEPARVDGQWIWTEEGKKAKSVPPGVRYFRKTFDLPSVPGKAILDISCDETFTVWLNGVELMKNPSPHYTQRVYAIEVAGRLRKGPNVLALQGSNRLDRLNSKFGTSAAVLAQIKADRGAGEDALVKTDETWKCSDQAPRGWNLAGFDDQSWTSARRWPDDGTGWPWQFAVWDSAVFPQLKSPLEPIKATGSGNVRDYKSWEGYPTLDSERVALQDGEISKGVADDRHFLRYASTHPLATAGPGGKSIGVFEEK